METDWLGAKLAEGRSIESIAKEVGKHPSTVGHSVTKFGLASSHAERHAAKGAPSPEVVATLVEEGLSLQQMAERLGVGATTVRHWLRRYGLTTARAQRSAGAERGQRVVIRECARHGYTAWVRSGTGGRYRCKRCRSEHVSARRRRVKRLLVEEAGGRCILCGYDRH